MSRTFLTTAVAALSLMLAGTTLAGPPKKVSGTVGPGFTVGLTLNGKKVTKLKAGVPYKFEITDKSSGHNFRLTGPGINRALTSVPFTGTKSFTLTLEKGTYRFVCDPHASSMKGSFTVA